MRFSRLCCIGLFAATASPTFANDIDLLFDEVPMVLTATRVEQPVNEAPASVTIIDREWIEHSSARNIPELLKMVPGMTFGYADGGTPIVSYHGVSTTSARRIQVLVDGRPIYDPVLGGAAWKHLGITLHDISSVEVIRGPNSAAYGANALLAIVNIRTLDPAESDDFTSVIRGGNNGYNDVFFRSAHTQGDVDSSISVSNYFDEGFDDVHDNHRREAIEGKVIYRVNAEDFLNVSAGIMQGYNQTGFEGADSDIPRDVDLQSFNVHAKWENNTQHAQQWYLRGYVYHLTNDDVYTIENVDTGSGIIVFAELDNRIEANRAEIEFQLQDKLSEKTHFTVGGSVRTDSVKAPTFFGTDSFIDSSLFRTFGSVNYRPMENIIYNASATVEHSDITDTQFSPRLAANYLINSNHSLRLIASRAVRNPTAIEELAEWTQNSIVDIGGGPTPFSDSIIISNGNIDPETTDSIELGYYGKLTNFTFDVKAFHDELSNLIGIDEQDPAEIDNYSALTKEGIETQISYQNRNARGQIAYTRLSAKSDDDGDLEDSVPDEIVTLSGLYKINNKWTVSSQYYYYDQIKWLESSFIVTNYETLDVKISRKINIGEANGKISLAIQNIGTESIQDYQEENILNERIYGEISLNL